MIKRLDLWLHSPFVRALRIAQFILAMAIFTCLALMPQQYAQQIPASDKYLHIIGNSLLFCSTWVAWHGRMKLKALITLLVIYSVSLEFAQWFTPSRHVDEFDLAANLTGLMVGFGCTQIIERLWAGLLNLADSPR